MPEIIQCSPRSVHPPFPVWLVDFKRPSTSYVRPQRLVTIFFSLYSKKPQGRNLKCQIAIQPFFKIVLYRCLALIRHNIATYLKDNKYIFDIPIPFCHNLYLSATLKQFLTEFAARYNLLHHVYMSIPAEFLRAI